MCHIISFPDISYHVCTVCSSVQYKTDVTQVDNEDRGVRKGQRFGERNCTHCPALPSLDNWTQLPPKILCGKQSSHIIGQPQREKEMGVKLNILLFFELLAIAILHRSILDGFCSNGRFQMSWSNPSTRGRSCVTDTLTRHLPSADVDVNTRFGHTHRHTDVLT